MTWADELKVIRRFLRDPNGTIWGNSILMGLYNQAQNELQQRLNAIESIANIHIPPRFNCSYTHDWEYGYFDDHQYRCFRNSGNNFSHNFRWEIQENYGIESDIGDEGASYSSPFEAFLSLTPGKPPAFPFPINLMSVKSFYHDEEPVDPLSKKAISSSDSSWVTRSGSVLGYYIEDDSSNQFYLYGQPTDITWDEESGSGMVTSVEDDTTSSEVGTFTQRSGSFLSSENGVAIDVIDNENNILVIYDIQPTEISSLSDTSDFPDYLQKYIRYRVLSLAYGANTDGRIAPLSSFWRRMSDLGMEAIKGFIARRSSDRDRSLRTSMEPAVRTRRHPRLPDGYPAI